MNRLAAGWMLPAVSCLLSTVGISEVGNLVQKSATFYTKCIK